MRKLITVILCLVVVLLAGRVWQELPVARGGVQKTPLHNGDVNCDGSFDISDAIATLNYLFLGEGEICAFAQDVDLEARLASVEKELAAARTELAAVSGKCLNGLGELRSNLVGESANRVSAEVEGRLSEVRAILAVGERISVSPSETRSVIDAVALGLRELDKLGPIDQDSLHLIPEVEDEVLAAVRSINGWIAQTQRFQSTATSRLDKLRVIVDMAEATGLPVDSKEHLRGLVLFNLEDLTRLASGPSFQTTKTEVDNALEAFNEKLNAIGDDAQLANIDLQNMLQKQQQVLQTISNVSKMLHDTAMAVIRKIG